MNPDPDRTVVLSDTHRIEVGISTWDEQAISIRNRYNGPDGRYLPRTSSELPLNDIQHVVSAAAQFDLLDSATCARLIVLLARSIERRTV